MKRIWLKLLLIPLILIVGWLSIGQAIVWYGSSLSPDDGIPWPGMDPVWLFVGQNTPGRGSENIAGARVYVNGHYVGSTVRGGPSLSVNLWRMKTYQVKVTKPGFHTWTGDVRPSNLEHVELDSSYRRLDITLYKQR